MSSLSFFYSIFVFVVVLLSISLSINIWNLLSKKGYQLNKNKENDLAEEKKQEVKKNISISDIVKKVEPEVNKDTFLPAKEDFPLVTFDENKWNIFGVSIQGRGHFKNNPPIPCQDSFCIKKTITEDKGWGVVVVCDGAGSHKYSHLGSKFVADYVADYLIKDIPDTSIYKEKKLPTSDKWRGYSKTMVRNTRLALADMVTEKSKDFSDISISNVGCTLIFCIYSPFGLLVGHIGDGRAGYRDEEGWKSMMIPFHGEYANQTVFINTDGIYKNNLENGLEPEKPYLETRVISAKNVNAFVLMSDGCENGFYYTLKRNENGRVEDINRPIKWFDTFIENLKEKKLNNSLKESKKYFYDIVNEGNKALTLEDDDKTIILGYLN